MIKSLALLFALLPTVAPAQSLPDNVVQAEVLGGWQTRDGTHMAALKLTLADGWKTYWRAPGDAGIPPSFSWTGSDNIGAVAFHWPRPEIFDLGGMRSIGYTHQLILPIEFTPARPGQPVTVSAEVELGVCSDICVPVTMQINAVLPQTTTSDKAIRAALATVPKPRKASRIHCTVDPLRDGLRLTAAIDIASAGGDEVVVFELADQSVWISEAIVARKGGQITASADLVPATAQPFALDRSSVRITLLGSNTAIDLHGCPS